jgi:hypothetical protein
MHFESIGDIVPVYVALLGSNMPLDDHYELPVHYTCTYYEVHNIKYHTVVLYGRGIFMKGIHHI